MPPLDRSTLSPPNAISRHAKKITTSHKPKKWWCPWRKPTKKEEPPRRNPATKVSPFPIPLTMHTPEWRRNPSILTPYCKPEVIRAMRSVSTTPTTSPNFPFVHALRLDPSLRPIEAVLNKPPTTANRYVGLLPVFFREGEVTRIAADTQAIERRIRDVWMQGRAYTTWWDVIWADLDLVCERAAVEYFAREDEMWIAPRVARRARRVTCSDAYRYREARGWSFGESTWWLSIVYPKGGKMLDRMVTDGGF
jgi:hypothetical protein